MTEQQIKEEISRLNAEGDNLVEELQFGKLEIVSYKIAELNKKLKALQDDGKISPALTC